MASVHSKAIDYGEKVSVVFIGGAQGTGKTTILRKLEERLPANTVSVMYTGELIFAMCASTFAIPWDVLNKESKIVVRNGVIKQITALKSKVTIIDGHYVELNGNEFGAIVPEDLAKLVSSHIIIEAQQEQVLERRSLDNSKKRNSINIELIRREQEAERKEAESIALKNGVGFHLIENNSVETAVNDLLALLRQRIN